MSRLTNWVAKAASQAGSAWASGRGRFVVERVAGPIVVLGALLAATGPAQAKSVVSCGGAALLGGAQLICSHLDPTAPAQFCTYSWALATPANQTSIVSGSFLLAPGVTNFQVYQGGGFVHAMSEPIVLCQGKRRAPGGVPSR